MIYIKSNLSGKRGSLDFAKRWLVCRAKGNVPIVCWHILFLSAGGQEN